MRKFLISAALAASALIAAAPAAAQWYPQQQQQGYGYGYQNNYGQTRRLQVRIDQLQRQINQLDRRNLLSRGEASRLRGESRNLEYRLRSAARYGLNGREAYDVERGIQRLEYRIQREARDGNRYAYNNGYYGGRDGNYGYRDNWSDHDRDGRNDRYEDDQGQDRDD
jgi:opacity protein-like surface antigen